MKRIVCLCLILLCSISFAFAQGGSGRTTKKKSVVKKINPQIAAAEKAWNVFFPKFKQAVINQDYNSVKAMLVKKVRCDSKESYEAEERGESDLRDACINHWKTTNKEYANDLYWNDLEIILSRYLHKIEKSGTEIGRTITYAKEYNDCSPDDLYAGFVFINRSWFLESFEHGECGD